MFKNHPLIIVIILTTLLFLTSSSLHCKEYVDNDKQTSNCLQDSTLNTVRNKSYVYTEFEEMAKYPGGNEALMKFIKEKVRVPDRVAKAGLRGRLNVSFIIKEDGFIDLDKNSINYFNHLKDKNGNPCNDSALIKLCEEEAYRVVTWMPRWIPGKQNGVLVKVKYNISIEFGKR